MSSTFFGLGVAYSGLSAQKRAMDVLAYNIANANDPTYKRQQTVQVEGAVLATSQEASPLGNSAIGSGVTSGDVERIVDRLIENRLRDATTKSAQWDYTQNTLSQLETMLGEPSDTGLQNDIDTFWNAWQTVANTPDDESIRSSLLEDTSALCQRIQYQYGQMSDVINDLNLEVVDSVNQINLMAQEVGKLNNEIGALSSGEMPVNDLLNRRDALVQEIAKYMDITVNGESGSDLVVSVGGTVLVQGTKVNLLTTETGTNGQQEVVWARDSQPVNTNGGQLYATLQLRDETIPGYMQQLDDIATELVSTVNAAHHTGQTLTGVAGGDFFKAGTTAANICLDDSIASNPKLVAASSSVATSAGAGNGDIARAIANLKGTPTSTGHTINEMYATMIGDIGSASASADTQSEASSLSLQQFTTQQQAVSGVSLDEEMTNMIKFQQAYNAASRVLSVMDQMLQVLINTGA